MQLDVRHILRQPGTVFALSAVQTIAPQDINGETVTFEPATLSGTLVAEEDGSVVVEGTLHAVAHAHCAKCLAPATCVVEGAFRENFIHGGDPGDDEIFSYEGSVIDLEKLALSYAMLNLPMRFLCRADCPGLLGFAGASDIASLRQDEQDNMKVQRPFAALQQLLAEKSDNESK